MKYKLAIATAGIIAVVIGVGIFFKYFTAGVNEENIAGDLINDNYADAEAQQQQSFQFTKEDVVRASKDYFNFKPMPKDEQNLKANPKVAEFKQALEAVFAVPWQNRAVASLDKLFHKILTSHDLTRQEKITLLWEYAQTRDSDIEYRYVVESIGTLSPIELIDPIITAYQSSVSKERKRVLLSVIDEALFVGAVETYPKAQQDFIGTNVIQAQRFLKASLYSESDPDLVIELLSTFISATGSEDEIGIVAGDFLSEQSNMKIPEQERRELLLKVTLENKSLQDYFLPQLLTPENREDTEFYDAVNVLVAAFGESKNSNFSAQGKVAFLDFINSRQIDFTQDNEIDSEKEHVYFNRLEALSALQANGTDQQPHEVLANHVLDNYVAKQSNPLEIATVLSLAEEPAVQLLKQRKSEILPVLEQSLRNPEFATSESKKELIQLGIEILTRTDTAGNSEESSS